VVEDTEVERKYDVDPDVPVPDLGRLAGVASVTLPVDLHQVATYLDTADLRLVRNRVTLRHRTGGEDDGWHLKLPTDGAGRREVRLPPGPLDEVPGELVDRVRAHVRDQPLGPVMELRTHRTVRRLLDADGGVLAELCDDRVQTRRPGGEVEQRWREWELELVDAGPDLLDRAEPLLREAGARPAGHASKVSRALAPALDAAKAGRPGPGGPVAAPEPTPDSTAGEVLVAYLAAHVAKLHHEDQRLRAGEHEGVHQIRVACRRMRSALATYRPVLDRAATDPVRDELRWLGGELARARDAQVQQQRLADLLAEQPPELVLGPVARRLDDELGERFRTGRAAGLEALDSPRYFRLLDRLDALVAHPPLSGEAGSAASTVLPRLLRRDLKRLRSRRRAVDRATTADERGHALHEVRKAAKRLRYAAESAQPVLGEPAARLAGQAEAVQELLGEHQDTVVGRELLRELGARAHVAGENGFTFGRLHALEQVRAEQLEAAYPDVVGRLPDKKLRLT
jgi:CHAD domain-containing protein